MQMRRERVPWSMLVLFAGIVAVLLALVAFGSRSYAAAEKSQNENSARRASLAYLVTRVRAADAQNAVALAEGPQGTALLLRDITPQGVYETRIYLYGGSLVEEYAAENTPYAPEAAQAVARTEHFSATLEHAVLTLQTDAGSACVALRAGGAA